MRTPTGFLVVRQGPTEIDYQGVYRTPPWGTDDPNETLAVDEYIFGSYKDEETNLIPTLEAAVRLLELFSSSKYRYEILFCCEGPEAAHGMERQSVKVEHLGYDVAVVTGDGWSIVEGFLTNDQPSWASSLRAGVNEFGLFIRREDAEAYWREYRERGEPDSEFPLEIVYVVRVILD